MKFEIIENIRNHNEWDSIKGFLSGIFEFLVFIILIPFLLIGALISLIKKEKPKEIVNEWAEFYSAGNLKLSRIFIDEDKLPENLDYPEESNDIYLFKLNSDPNLDGLENKFFDYQYSETVTGIYLLSFNEVHQGMTLWFINNQKPKLEKVKDLKSSWWDLSMEGKVIKLRATLNKKDLEIEIKEN